MMTERSYLAHAFRALTDRMVRVLQAFFGGYLIVESPALNDVYLLLVRRARELAPDPKASAALEDFLDMFPNLYESIGHPDSPDERWEFGQDIVRALKGRASELWVESAAEGVSLREPELTIVQTCDEVLRRFVAVKRQEDQRFVAAVEQAAARRKQGNQAAAATPPAVVRAPATALEDEAHAACVEALVAKLHAEGLRPKTEVTYSRYGERGSVDVCCLEAPGSADGATGCAVYEVWTQITNPNQALRKLDEKARVVPEVVAQQEAIPTPSHVRAHLVLLATKQNMELIASHRQTLLSKFSEGLTSGTRFLLQAFDPIAGDLHTLLPAPQRAGGGLDSSELRRWSRFPSRAAFLEAWRERRQ